MELKYRPEIDGLRTVAVVSVIIYHLEIFLGSMHVAKGGFFGVDVFFVISGYLITSILMREYFETGKISISTFYERRARRILPALYVVILFSLPMALILLSPTQLIDFSKSILSSIAFGSNFYWDMSLQEYGAESALLKPFLHTWSLSVEEQYYIVFPLLLVALFNWARRHVIVVLFVIFLVSLLYAESLTGHDASASFYMLPSRLWELLAGSLLANIQYFYPPQKDYIKLNKAMPSVGMSLILYAIFFIDFEAHHPGLITLLPVVGTVLIIWFASEEEIITKILASKTFVGIGLISYALYLWHYPIFAFGRIVDPDATWHDKVQWIVFTVLFSLFSYSLIEKPFRNRARLSLNSLCWVLLTTFLIIAAVSSAVITNFIKSPRLVISEKYNPDNQAIKKSTWDLAKKMPKSWSKSEEEKDKLKLLLIGNSHSKDIYNAIVQTPELMNVLQLRRRTTQIGKPKEKLIKLLESPLFIGSEVVVISTRYIQAAEGKTLTEKQKQKLDVEVPDLERLDWLIQQIKSRDKRVIVLSNTVEFAEIKGLPIFDWWMRNLGPITNEEQRLEMNKLFYKNINRSKLETLNEKVEDIARANNVLYMKKSDFLCDLEMKVCDGITDDGYKVFYDYGHFTIEGARYIGKKMYESGWLLPALTANDPNIE